MTTNTIRWVQACIVCMLIALAGWLTSEGLSGKTGVAHLIVALFTMVAVLILMFHPVIGDGVFNRVIILVFGLGALWFGLGALNDYVLHGAALLKDLLVAGGCLVGFFLEVAALRWNERAEEYEQGE